MLRLLQIGLFIVALACGYAVFAGWLHPMYEADQLTEAFGRNTTLTPSVTPFDMATIGLTADKPLGVLRIERLNINVPVFKGTGDDALDAGAGWIRGTADLNSDGNIGLSAHRDTYFRNLKDVEAGDQMRLTTDGASRHYTVMATEIVDPSDISVLEPTADNWLTLVTCYPFYFIGNAPKRFIVFAKQTESGDRS